MAMIFDREAIIQALKKSEATPEQQRDAACLLLLLHRICLSNFDDAEQIYLTLKGSCLAGEYTPREKEPAP